jgi:hypothetical protein
MEDGVIDAVRDHLLEQAWKVLSSATAAQHGDDLVAQRDPLDPVDTRHPASHAESPG